jgi:hypothetical protein
MGKAPTSCPTSQPTTAISWTQNTTGSASKPPKKSAATKAPGDTTKKMAKENTNGYPVNLMRAIGKETKCMGLEFGNPRANASLILIRGSGLGGRNRAKASMWAGMAWFMKGVGGGIAGNLSFI